MKYINAKQILTEVSLRHWVGERTIPQNIIRAYKSQLSCNREHYVIAGLPGSQILQQNYF